MDRTNRTSNPYLAQLVTKLKLLRDKIKPQGAIGGRLGFNIHPKVSCAVVSCNAEVYPRVFCTTASCNVKVHPRVFYAAVSYDAEVHPRVFYNAIGGPSGTG